jgi:hypothetical protein
MAFFNSQMVDGIICASIGAIWPHCPEHRHIQAAVDRFQTRLHFQRELNLI